LLIQKALLQYAQILAPINNSAAANGIQLADGKSWYNSQRDEANESPLCRKAIELDILQLIRKNAVQKHCKSGGRPLEER
jgi:hypothetical protein